MKNELYLLIAGVEEGFSYSSAYQRYLDDEYSVEACINSLRAVGYRIFIVMKQTARIDDIAGTVVRVEEVSE